MQYGYDHGRKYTGVYFRSNERKECISNEGLIINLFRFFSSTKLLNNADEQIVGIPPHKQLDTGFYLVDRIFQATFQQNLVVFAKDAGTVNE